jgi:polyhydroxyalkanoate synthase
MLRHATKPSSAGRSADRSDTPSAALPVPALVANPAVAAAAPPVAKAAAGRASASAPAARTSSKRLSTTARSSRSDVVAAAPPSRAKAPLQRAGTRERGGSPWLGQSPSQSELFRRYQDIDRMSLSLLAPLTGGQSPATLNSAFADWWTHLAVSRAKQLELAQFGAEQWLRLFGMAPKAPPEVDASAELPQDKRFANPLWSGQPFNALAQAFLLGQQWWHRATTGVPGVSAHHQEMVSFSARQMLDMVAPSNFVATNPVVLQRTIEEGGRNLLRGMAHAQEDATREKLGLPPAGADDFKVGQNIAITPGSVIYRNRLIELIQYEPSTPATRNEPVLIVPAWIMKYYVLDLSPHNSMVKALVDRGFTVFAISWKNPDAGDRDLGLADYHDLGVRDALEAIAKVMPGAQTHALGYCLGGTLLAIAAAVLGREDADAARPSRTAAGATTDSADATRQRVPPLKSVTLLAAQTDFTEPGEISLFIDESQINFLEHQMWRQGYLDEKQMRGTFQMLRSKDLIWSYRLVNYLLGERRPVSDLMAWNADGTRLPFRMQSEYLRTLFLHNALSHGEFELHGVPVSLDDIRVPVFNVGAVQDHIAPWRSVFKLNRLTDADQTFVLTAGGHNVGIVNPPGQAASSYRIAHWTMGDRLLTPDEWLATARQVDGSWWTAWFDWLLEHSSGSRTPPAMGAPRAGLKPLVAAPGTYVMQG